MKIRDQEEELEVANKKIREQEEEIGSFLRTMEQNDDDFETCLEHDIKELEEELECPVCLEVAKMAPIYKCQEDHLVCRSQTLLRHHEPFVLCSGSAAQSWKTALNADLLSTAHTKGLDGI